MRRPFIAALFACLPLFGAGCGNDAETNADGEVVTVEDAQENQTLEDIEAFLKAVAQTGDVSYSQMYGMDESLRKLGKEDLIEDLNRLGQARGKAAQDIAKDMLVKL